MTSVVVARRAGGFVAVSGRGVVTMDERGAIGDVIATLPTADDGRVDPHGRLWVGDRR
jgi:sugar lactone lactonase YvrE